MAPKVSEAYRQNVREKIMQSAEALFALKGYHRTSMDDIVNESGLSKGAIYSYFESKQELFLALSDRRMGSMMQNVKSIFESDEAAIQKLEKAINISFGYFVETCVEDCQIELEFWVEAPRIESLKKRLTMRYNTIHQFLVDYLNNEIKNGRFREDLDTNAMASLIMATIRGLSLHRAMTGLDFSNQEIKQEFLNLLIRGIRVEK